MNIMEKTFTIIYNIFCRNINENKIPFPNVLYYDLNSGNAIFNSFFCIYM